MLQKQLVEIPLAGGVDTKSDPKIVGQDAVLSLQNGDLDTSGAVKKRYGYTRTSVLTRLSKGLAVKSGGLVRFGESRVNSYLGLPSSAGGGTSGGWLNAAIDVHGLANPSTSLTAVDVAVADGVLGYVHLDNDSSGTPRVTFTKVNASSRELIASPTTVSAATTRPRIVCTQDGTTEYFIVAVQTSTTNVKLTRYTTDSSGSSYTFNVTIHSDQLWDICSDDVDYGTNQYGVVLAFKNGSSDIETRRYSATLASLLTTYTSTPTSCASALTVAKVFNQTIVGYYDSTNTDVYAVRIPANWTSAATISSVTNSATAPRNLSVAALSDDQVLFAWEDSVTQCVSFAYRPIDWSSGATLRQYGNTRLVSKLGTYREVVYFLLSFDSDVQSSSFLCVFSMTAEYLSVGKVLSQVADGQLSVANHLPSFVYDSTNDVYVTAAIRRERLLSDGEVLTGGVAATFDFSETDIASVNIGDELIVGGAKAGFYDRACVELGFDAYPEIVSLTASNGAGSIANGTYSYVAVWEWTDANGRLHRSAPSPAKSITVSGADDTVTVAVGILRHTFKADVECRIYRTQDGGTTYQKCTALAYNPETATTAVTFDIVDVDADATISDNEVLYTDGGVLENIAPPAPLDIALSSDRLWVIPAEKRESVWFSKQRGEGLAFEFSDLLVRTIPADGDNTALASMDGNIIVFKERATYVIGGEGPNNLGQGDFFATRKISSDVGCVHRASVAETDLGVFFQSHRGIYLLDRGLQFTYIGAPVEDYNQYSVRSSAVLRDQQKVVFALSDDATMLVFDLFHKKWVEWKNHNVGACVDQDGALVYAINSASVGDYYTQSTSSYLDGSTSYAMQIDTAWVKVAGIQGFQRIYWVGLLGEFRTAHTINVKVYYDYDETAAETITGLTSSILTGGDTKYQVRFKPARQKCQAVRFRIYDSSGSGTEQNYEITALSMMVGVKGGINRLMSAKTL